MIPAGAFRRAARSDTVPPEIRVLAEHTSDFGTVTILQSMQTRSHIYRQNGVFQSEADTNGISTVPYIHAIFGLLRQVGARRVLIVGGAGGTLGTMLARSGCEVAIVDVNPVAFIFAHRYFALPWTVECHVRDGLEHLRTTTQRYDAIVLDAYDGDVIPEHLKSEAFLARVRASLGDKGFFFANVHVHSDNDIGSREFAKAVSPYWPQVRLLDRAGEENRNTIVIAGPDCALAPPRMELAPMLEGESVASALAAMAFRAA
jgi:spermidine synthase